MIGPQFLTRKVGISGILVIFVDFEGFKKSLASGPFERVTIRFKCDRNRPLLGPLFDVKYRYFHEFRENPTFRPFLELSAPRVTESPLKPRVLKR